MLVLAGCSTAQGAGPGAAGADDGIEMIPVAQRKPVPDVAGRGLDDQPVILSGFAGKVVVVNLWGSWCGPCRGEADDLAKVAGETADKGVQFFGIDVKDLKPDAPRAFVREHGITYPNLYDPQGMTLLGFPPSVLNAQAIPSTLVVDRSGRIAARALQPLTGEQLHRMVDPVVAEGQ